MLCVVGQVLIEVGERVRIAGKLIVEGAKLIAYECDAAGSIPLDMTQQARSRLVPSDLSINDRDPLTSPLLGRSFQYHPSRMDRDVKNAVH